MICCQRSESVSFFDYANESAFYSLLRFNSRGRIYRGGVIFISQTLDLTVTEIDLLVVVISPDSFNDITRDDYVIADLIAVAVVCLIGIVNRFLDDTENGIANGLLIGSGNFVVCKVGAVDLTADRSCLIGIEALEIEESSGAVREEVVSLIRAVTCAHVGKNEETLKRIERLIESDTVCGKSYRQSVILYLVLKSHSEYGGICAVGGIFRENVVVFKFLKRVFGTVFHNNCLSACQFAFARIRVKHVHGHSLDYREFL